MDYTKQELRPLIYQDRLSIDDFDIDDPESLDAIMLERIERSEIVEFDGAAKYILQIFNNAYYITTLILMEKHPLHYFSSYMIIAEHTGSAYNDIREKNTLYRFFECMIMAMVWNYLCACQPEIYKSLKDDNLLLKNIWDHHNKAFFRSEWDGNARFLFFNNVLGDGELMKCHVDKNKFVPLTSVEELKAMAMIKKEKSEQPEMKAQRIAPETIASLENDLLAFKTRDKKNEELPLFTAKQIAIFIKAILLEHNSLTNNVKMLAPLVQRFSGFAGTTAENALGHKVTQEECDKLAKVFDEFAPKIGNIIKGYPEKYEKLKGKKLKENLTKQ